MKRLIALISAISILAACSGCMYSKTIVVEDIGYTAEHEDIETVSNARMINSSVDHIDYIGIDSCNRLISLNLSGNEYTLSSAYVSDPSLQRTILVMDNISEAVLANHGRNVVFTSIKDDVTFLYSYSLNSGSLMKLCEDPSEDIISDLYAVPAYETVAQVILNEDEMYVEKFNLITGKCVQYAVNDFGMKTSLRYIAGSTKIEGVTVDDGSRVTIKATNDSGSFIVSAVCTGPAEELVSTDASSAMPQLRDNEMFYINKHNELVMLDFDSRIERKLADSVKAFSLASDKDSIAYISTEEGMDMLYVMQDVNSKSRLIDMRKGINDVKVSSNGNYMVISYSKNMNESSKDEFLVYSLEE